MTEPTSAIKKSAVKESSPQQISIQGNEGDYAAPLNMAMLATGRNHNAILQLQRSVGNRTTQKLLQREGTGDTAPKSDAPAAGPEVVPTDLTKMVLSDDDYNICKGIYLSKPDWNYLKTYYIETAPDPLQMAKLWAFRRKYVVDLIKSLRSTKYPNLLAKSAGSNDASSDYDITLASPGNDNDVKAIEDFNNQVKADFGVQPGTIFDTNLYAKDYGAINQSDEFKDGASPDDTVPGHTAAMEQVEYDFQDVAALLKLRRYMDQAEWDSYVENMLTNIDVGKRGAVQRKYDEADGIYQIYVSTLLAQVREVLDEEQHGAEDESSQAEKETHAQEHQAHDLHVIGETHSDTVLDQSNQLYLARMSKIRSIQASTAQLEGQYGALETIGNITPEVQDLVAEHFENPVENLAERIEAERAQVKQLLAEAILYAAEAYISQGAIRHVVAGIQGAKLTDEQKTLPQGEQDAILKNKRDAANAKLDFNDLQQSFNEQLGDFLKDFGHLKGSTDGEFYIKSSKYIDRMLDVVLIMRGRMGASFPAKLGIEEATGKTFDQIVGLIKTLYSARGKPKVWPGEREAKSKGYMAEMGVVERPQLKGLLLNLGSEISALIRNQTPAAADGDTEMSFFQNRNTAFD